MARDDKVRRRNRIAELLGRGQVARQDDLVRTLEREGWHVTQATVSRDLEELGATRRRRGHRFVYELPDRNGPPVSVGIRLMPEMVIDAIPSGNLVVVRTFPGMAPTVAAVVDGAELAGAIGTVAGDDTVLVVAAEGTSGRTLAKRIRSLGRG